MESIRAADGLRARRGHVVADAQFAANSQPLPQRASRRRTPLANLAPPWAASCPIDRASTTSRGAVGWPSCTGRCWPTALTPVSTFARLGRGPYSFLLESVVGGEKWAAYSFLGVRPRAVFRARGRQGGDPAARGRRLRGRRAARGGRSLRRAGRAGAGAAGGRAARAAPLLRRRRGLAGLRRRSLVRAAARAGARRAGAARGLLRADRHRRHLRQPARHLQGGGLGGRGRGRSRSRLRRRLRPHRGGAGPPGRALAAAAPPLDVSAASTRQPARAACRAPPRAASRPTCAGCRSTSRPATPSRSCSRSASTSPAGASIPSTSTGCCA